MHASEISELRSSYITLVISSGAGIYFSSSGNLQQAATAALSITSYVYVDFTCYDLFPIFVPVLRHFKIAIQSYSLLYNAHCAFENAVLWRTPPDVGPVGHSDRFC
jgi:hypothetical protein